MEDQRVGGERYCYTLSLTSALDGSGLLKPRTGRFTSLQWPGTRCMLEEAGWAQRLSGRVRKNLPPRDSIPQPDVRRSTDFAIPTHAKQQLYSL